MRIIKCKLIAIACYCLTTYLSFIIHCRSFSDIQQFAICKRYYSKLARKGGTAWKKWTPFCKILMFKKHYFDGVLNCNVFKVILQLFEKSVVGCPSKVRGAYMSWELLLLNTNIKCIVWYSMTLKHNFQQISKTTNLIWKMFKK